MAKDHEECPLAQQKRVRDLTEIFKKTFKGLEDGIKSLVERYTAELDKAANKMIEEIDQDGIESVVERSTAELEKIKKENQLMLEYIKMWKIHNRTP